MVSQSPAIPECCIITVISISCNSRVLYHNGQKNSGNFFKTGPVNISNRTSCVVTNGYAIMPEKTPESPVTSSYHPLPASRETGLKANQFYEK